MVREVLMQVGGLARDLLPVCVCDDASVRGALTRLLMENDTELAQVFLQHVARPSSTQFDHLASFPNCSCHSMYRPMSASVTVDRPESTADSTSSSLSKSPTHSTTQSTRGRYARDQARDQDRDQDRQEEKAGSRARMGLCGSFLPQTQHKTFEGRSQTKLGSGVGVRSDLRISCLSPGSTTCSGLRSVTLIATAPASPAPHGSITGFPPSPPPPPPLAAALALALAARCAAFGAGLKCVAVCSVRIGRISAARTTPATSDPDMPAHRVPC